MHSDWETFIEAYTNASTDVKEVIDSEAIVQFVDMLINKYQVAEEKKRILVAQISDLILLLVPVDELAARIIKENNIPEENKKAFSDDLKHFFNDPFRSVEGAGTSKSEKDTAEPDERFRSNKEDISEDDERTEASQLTSEPPQNTQGEQPPSEESVPDPNDIAPLRTMQQDAERVHGYGEYRKKNPHPDQTPDTKSDSTESDAIELPRYVQDEDDRP